MMSNTYKKTFSAWAFTFLLPLGVLGCSGGATNNSTSTPPVSSPVISSFSANPTTITIGQSSALSFSVSGATTLTLTGATGSPVSPATVTPSATTTYTLTASNAGGSTTATATVTVNPAPTTFTLTVVGGYGSGTYAAGAVVDVFAATAAPTTAFKMWTGNTGQLIDSFAWHTTFTAAAGTTSTVTANYTLGTPAVSGTAVQVPGTNTGTSSSRITTPSPVVTPITIAYQIPPSHPNGIIFELHGGGGTYQGWFKQEQKINFNGQALAAGYGIIADNSAADGVWDSQTTYPNNLDVNNAQAIVTYLTGLGVMSASDELYTIGESDGGSFSATLARDLQFRASAIYIASGLSRFYDPSVAVPTVNGATTALTPSLWFLQQRDGTSGVAPPGIMGGIIGVGPAGIAQAHCNAVELKTLQNPVPACNTNVTLNPFPNSDATLNYYVNQPSPAYPSRFNFLLTPLSSTTAQAIDAWMITQGCIDTNGFILVDPYQATDFGAPTNTFKCSQTALLSQFGGPPNNLTSQQAGDLTNQFLIAYTEHKFTADLANKVLDFFAAH